MSPWAPHPEVISSLCAVSAPDVLGWQAEAGCKASRRSRFSEHDLFLELQNHVANLLDRVGMLEQVVLNKSAGPGVAKSGAAAEDAPSNEKGRSRP